MSKLVSAGAWIWLGTLAGCVTTPEAVPPAPELPAEAASAAAAAPAPIATPAPAGTPPAPVDVAAVLSVDLGLDWQKILMDDVAAVEAQGDAFLSASSKLYEQLLDETAVTPERRQQIDQSVQQSAALYSNLTSAVGKLKQDLNRQDVKSALPLQNDDKQQEFAAVTELFSFYQPVQSRSPYDPGAGASVALVLFGDQKNPGADGLDSLPKPQRDALQLLDYLSRISGDLAYLSDTVTDWVDVRKGLTEEIAH